MHCQKCKTYIRPDASLQNLNNGAFSLLTDSEKDSSQPPPRPASSFIGTSQGQAFRDASKQSQNAAYRRSVVKHDPPGMKAGEMSFVMLNGSQHLVQTPKKQQRNTHDGRSARSQNEAISHQMAASERLFEVMSAHSDIDHPVCGECAQTLIEDLERRIASATKERNTFAAFLKDLQAELPSAEDRTQVENELSKLQSQETSLVAELERLESEQADLAIELDEVEKESLRLERDEEKFWKDHAASNATLSDLNNKRESLQYSIAHDYQQLERLQRTNVYNDTFCISHDGSFGTINGLRLGRVSQGAVVDWSEINAAWGQALLLLATIAAKLKFNFSTYRLNPLGSVSTIEKVDGASSSTSSWMSNVVEKSKTSLPLYHSSEIAMGMGLFNRNFDNAMVAFLECVRQIGLFVERSTKDTVTGGDRGLRLPYEINKDKVRECSIRLGGFGGDESFTRACKYTLTCLKFLLAHASNLESSSVNSTNANS